MTISDDLLQRIVEIGADRTAGAHELGCRAVTVLEDAFAVGEPIAPIARALCLAQPAMAPLWNASVAALAARSRPERFQRFAKRVAGAEKALTRFAVSCLTVDARKGPLHVVTLSMSRSVGVALAAASLHRQVRLSCAESRPGLEGRLLASRLAVRGIPATVYADAAIAHALADADAVMLGADAIGANGFVNKTGSRMLIAAAAQQGVPVYVAATRDKFVGAALASRLTMREGAAGEIWDTPPRGVTVRNPYFEVTPLDGVTAVISDAGILGAGMVPDVCEASADPASVQALLDLLDEVG